MTKPYYNPETKETYIKASWTEDGVTFICRAITGAVSFERGFMVSRNEFGEEVRRTPTLTYGVLSDG